MSRNPAMAIKIAFVLSSTARLLVLAMPKIGAAPTFVVGDSRSGYLHFRCDLTTSCELWPPMLQNEWTDVNRPEDWRLRDASIVPLGSGKVCIARFFLTRPEESIEDMSGHALLERENFAVLEGVKVLKAGVGRLRMVKHKSERYVFGRDLAITL
ncbi:hypothetical protein ZWY2020_038395 [Hordeum vulgare]|nr:hypothetical protein ZWY2020_038395 [Hordeum vulgare]